MVPAVHRAHLIPTAFLWRGTSRANDADFQQTARKTQLRAILFSFCKRKPRSSREAHPQPCLWGGGEKKTEVGTHACRFPPPPSPPGLPAGNQETGWRPRAGAGGGEGLTGVGASRAERCEFRPLPPAPLPPSL